MPEYTNAKRVLHKFIGGTQTFSDDTIWEELELPTGSTGHILAQVDSVNKTVLLFGMVSMTNIPASPAAILIPAQKAWKFASITTSASISIGDFGNNYYPGVLSTDTNGNLLVAHTSGRLPEGYMAFTKSGVNYTQLGASTSFHDLTPATFSIELN